MRQIRLRSVSSTEILHTGRYFSAICVGTRAKLLAGLAEKGFGAEQMGEMQRIIDAEKSDLFDVLTDHSIPVTSAFTPSVSQLRNYRTISLPRRRMVRCHRRATPPRPKKLNAAS